MVQAGSSCWKLEAFTASRIPNNRLTSITGAMMRGALAALLMAIAIRCKTFKEAQANATVLVLAISMLPFFYNVYITARKAPKVTVNDPWGYGRSLEWATSCPPPRHNFTSIPRIRSESPAFDVNHPEAGVPVGIGPMKDAPEAPVYDLSTEKVK